MLTHGGYEELENCVGKTVIGTPLGGASWLVHISLSELIKVGAVDYEDWFDDYLFFIGVEVEEIFE